MKLEMMKMMAAMLRGRGKGAKLAAKPVAKRAGGTKGAFGGPRTVGPWIKVKRRRPRRVSVGGVRLMADSRGRRYEVNGKGVMRRV